MSIIPSIFGMDNYYKPYHGLAHKLRKKDIGKAHIKVIPSHTPSGGMDCSYTDGEYTLVSTDFDTHGELEKVVLREKNGKLWEIDTKDWYHGRTYFNGWVTVEEAKNIKPDTKISRSHIDLIKSWQ